MIKDLLLQSIRQVLPMHPSKAEQIAEKFREKEITKNEYILKEGAICRESYFIEEGLMRAYTHDLDGNDVTTAFYSTVYGATDIFSFFR